MQQQVELESRYVRKDHNLFVNATFYEDKQILTLADPWNQGKNQV